MNRLLRSSSVSLALGYFAFGVIALILFAAPLWYAWEVTLEHRRAEILRSDAQSLTDVFYREGPAGLKSFIDQRVHMNIAGDRILLLTDPASQKLAGNLTAWPAGVRVDPGTHTVNVALAGHPTRAVFVRTVLPGGYNLLVGRDLAPWVPVAKYSWYGLSGAIATLAIVGAWGGMLIRRAVLLRVESIRTAVLAIVQGDLSHRLPTKGSADELDTLSRTINVMLDDIEQLVHGIRDVSNAIAHDLRTPLTELRSRLEELAVTRPSAEETFGEIDGAVTDVDRVIGIFNALLRLAEIDTGARRSGFGLVNATELGSDAVEFYRPAAELKAVTLMFRATRRVLVSGDALLLAQAVGNLIDNALKYAGDNKAVNVEVHQHQSGAVEISVSDNGPGIPVEERSKATQRFYRGDSSRSTPGVGLGLALVAAVAKLHGGSLELTDNHPGLRATLIVQPDALLSGLQGRAPEALRAGSHGIAEASA
jgi:signal transduction histidine kinase